MLPSRTTTAACSHRITSTLVNPRLGSRAADSSSYSRTRMPSVYRGAPPSGIATMGTRWFSKHNRRGRPATGALPNRFRPHVLGLAAVMVEAIRRCRPDPAIFDERNLRYFAWRRGGPAISTLGANVAGSIARCERDSPARSRNVPLSDNGLHVAPRLGANTELDTAADFQHRQFRTPQWPDIDAHQDAQSDATPLSQAARLGWTRPIGNVAL